MSSSNSSQDFDKMPSRVNIEIQLHEIDKYDFRGYVFTSRAEEESGNDDPEDANIPRVDVETYIREEKVHISVKARNVLVPKFVVMDPQLQSNEIQHDGKIHTCDSRRSSIREPCTSYTSKSVDTTDNGEPPREIVGTITPSVPDRITGELHSDDEESQSSMSSADNSALSEILL